MPPFRKLPVHRLITLLFVFAVLPVIALSSYLVYRGLGDERQLQETRDRDFMHNAALQVSENVSFELYSLFASLSPNLRGQNAQRLLPDATELNAGIRHFLEISRYPSLLSSVVYYQKDIQGVEHYKVWDRNGWKEQEKPSWFTFNPKLVSSPTGAKSSIHSTFEFPVFTTVNTGYLSPDVQAIAVLIDRSVVLQTMVPDFVQQALYRRGSRTMFQMQVVSPQAATKPVFNADLRISLFSTASLESWDSHYLLRLNNAQVRTTAGLETGQEAERIVQAPASANAWYLDVRRTPDGLKAFEQAVHVRDTIVSVLIFLVLGGGSSMVFLSAKRMHRAALNQQKFSALVSHELRTPLASLRSLSDNISSGRVPPERMPEYGKALSDATQRLTHMVDNVLLLSVMQDDVLASLQEFDLVQVIDEVLERFSELGITKNARILFNHEEGLFRVSGNRAAVAAALDNLIGNAIIHGTDDGLATVVEIDVQNSRRLLRSGVRVVVRDYGPGIRASERRRVFRPFTKGQHALAGQLPGSGVGLSLVKAVAEAIGGSIHVGSTQGKGATFVLWLRRSPR